MRLLTVSLLGVLLAACGKDADPDLTTASSDGGGEDTFGQGTTSGGSDPTSPTTTNTTNTSNTSTSTTTSGDPTVATTEPDPSAGSITLTATSGDDSTTSTTTGDSTTVDPSGGGECNDPKGQPQDADCTDASGCGCASGKCFVVPILGGWCGECLGDGDCAPGGCTIPDPINSIGPRCNMGEPGAGCETDKVCADPQFDKCGTVLEVAGIITVATCGECTSNADCSANAPNCTPVYDIAHFTGAFGCVPNKSVPNDFGCNLAEDGMGDPIGDQACASGRCGEANVMGLLKVGICGECNSDADCNGQTCTAPIVDPDNSQLIGATCQ